jgi:hypothetical protein
MVPPWRTIKGAEPDAIKVASPVLNGEREETGEGLRLALTPLPRSGFRQRLTASVRLPLGESFWTKQNETVYSHSCLRSPQTPLSHGSYKPERGVSA